MARSVARVFYAAFAALFFSGLLLASCSNPIDLLETVQTDVKRANGKFLLVSEVSPARNATSVSPGAALWIQFDRALNVDTVTAETITFSPAAEWTATFNTEKTKLALTPAALEGGTEYTVTVTTGDLGVQGEDGSTLENPYTWSFTTANVPIGSIQVESQNTNSEVGYTNNNNVKLVISYNALVDDYRYSILKTDITTDEATGIQNWTSKSPTPIANFPLGGADGSYTVYIQFRHGSGVDAILTDGVNPISDTIVLDTNAPTLDAFSINNGSSSTGSNYVTLNSTVTDIGTGVSRIYTQNFHGLPSSADEYAASYGYSLPDKAGLRMVYMYVRDRAGNASGQMSDSIIYCAVKNMSATRGTTSLGTVNVSWTAPTADGDTIDNYYVWYYRYDGYPTAASPSYTTFYTMSTSNNVSETQGILDRFYLQFHIAGANVWSPRTDGTVWGYTSNVAVVYDSGNTADTTTAANIKTVLTKDLTATYPAGYGPTVTGTMPIYTVTLVPQSLVPTTAAAGNVFSGQPVIVTPGTTLTDGQSYNVTAHSHGVIAMGSGGAHMLDRINSNWSSWGFSGTQPSAIGWGPSWSIGPSVYVKTWTSSNGYWNYPLQSTVFTGATPPSDQTRTQIAYTLLGRVSVYHSGGDASMPGDSCLFGLEDAYTVYFPVVRHGRFLQFGFEGLPDRPFTGWVYFTNLTYRMGMY